MKCKTEGCSNEVTVKSGRGRPAVYCDACRAKRDAKKKNKATTTLEA